MKLDMKGIHFLVAFPFCEVFMAFSASVHIFTLPLFVTAILAATSAAT
jgi:hypothetical protein